MKMRWIAAAALLMVFPIVLAVTAEDAAPAPEGAVSVAPAGSQPPGTEGLLAGDESPLSLTGCSAEKNCSCSPQWVSCTGSTSCTVGSNSVTCDGNTVTCPDPNIPPPCADPVGWCACRDAGGNRPTCTGLYC